MAYCIHMKAGAGFWAARQPRERLLRGCLPAELSRHCSSRKCRPCQNGRPSLDLLCPEATI